MCDGSGGGGGRGDLLKFCVPHVFKVPQILEYVEGRAGCVVLLFYYYLHFSINVYFLFCFLFFCYTYFCVVNTVNFFALNFSFFKFSTST